MDMASSTTTTAVLDTLNQAQRRAVTSTAATVAILAGPGSGKTHTLTSRVVWLVDTVRYQPEDVIVATFTVKASREMKERIGKALGNERAKKIILGTFHSISRRYLAAYGKRIGLDQKFGIADDADSRAIVSRICKRLHLSVDPPLARAWISKKKSRGLDDSLAKKSQHAKNSESQRELDTCYAEYQSHLQRSNLLDYDDLLVKCVELLQRFPSCVSNVQSVLIDEYQDTNGIQYELMRLFAQKQRRITVVGDPDQSIYGWRSAEIRNLYRLLKDYPGTDEVSLEENYRSSQSILDTSLKVIQQDLKRYQKVLLPIHNKGTRPVLRRLKTAAKEAAWIVTEIQRTLMMSGNMMTHDDVAILVRSAALSRHIESALTRSSVPYRMVGGFKFYERVEIKIILDYLRVIHQPDNNDALTRIINVPRRGIGDGTVKSLLEEAEVSSTSLWKLLDQICRGDRRSKTSMKKQAEQRLSGELIRFVKDVRKRIDEATPSTPFTLVEIIDRLLAHLKFQQFLQSTYSEDEESRWQNVQEFISLASDFTAEIAQTGDDSLPGIEGLEQIKESDVLAKFLSSVALSSEIQQDDGEEKKPLVTISTIHAAKGLEWPIVFVPATYNGSIPHMRSEDSDEERRLLYVAMTRAKALLYLSCPSYGSQGTGEKLELSPFLSPISSEYFANRGPSFHRQALGEMGRILRRDVPSDEAIFKPMPLQATQEDDLFPIDPDHTDEQDSTYGGSRMKRPRLYGPAGGTEHDGSDWRREYNTTMDQTSNFTMSSLPGFISAGAVAETKAMAVGIKAPGCSVKKPKMLTSTTKRSHDQASLLGFFGNKSGAKPDKPTNATQKTSSVSNFTGSLRGGRPQSLANSHKPNTPGLPATQSELTSHKLGSGTVRTRPALPKRENEAGGEHYSHFSSSPTRLPTRDALSRSEDTIDENRKSWEEASQPAATFHKTTCVMPRGGFKKPQGLSRAGISRIERVNKPFKPLTINRS